MSEAAFFDANACLGPSAARRPGAPYDRPGLLAEMDQCRISRALVWHAAGRELDARRANRELLSSVADEPRLVAQAVINPAPRSADRDLAAETNALIDAGVRAFRMFPLYHGVDFNELRLRDTLALLAARGSALWLDFDQLWYNFDQLGEHEQRVLDFGLAASLARDYPDLRLVLVGVNFTHHTRLLGLLGKHLNVLVETSLLQGFEIIERICNEFGAERLLFGTGVPVTAPGAARAMLAYADISDDERRMAASANLEALLVEPATMTLPDNPERDSLLAAADSGTPMSSIPVHDCHGHIAPDGHDGHMGLTLGPQDADSIISACDRLGIDSICVSSWGLAGGDIPGGNRTAALAAEKHPGRIMPYAVVNPNYPEHWEGTVRECFERRDFFGLKPYPLTMRTALSAEPFRPMLEFADRRRLPVLCHFGFHPLAGVTAGEIELLAPRYPGAVFIIAHAGASYRVADRCAPLARRLGNVYLDPNYTSVPFGMIEYLAANAGVEKVLFGTDAPMRNPAPILGWVVYSRIDEREKKSLLGGNFRRMVESTGRKLK